MLKDGKIDNNFAEAFRIHYEDLFNKVISKIIDRNGGLVPNYTLSFLKNFYKLIEKYELATFIKNNYVYFEQSKFCKKWIPYCILNAPTNKKLENLIKFGVITRSPFRINKNAGIITDDIVKLKPVVLAKFIEDGVVHPSIDVFYWSIELANRCHIGNDYGFFERYADYLGTNLNIQLTSSFNPDSFPLFQLAEDFSFNLFNNIISYKNNGSKSKKTRINSMNAAYLIIGDKIKKKNTLSSHSTILNLQ